jgi:hypothetical protein
MIGEPMKVELKSDLIGVKKLILGGKDVSAHVRSLKVEMCCDDITLLSVEFLNVEVVADMDLVGFRLIDKKDDQ